jgi:FG-GAP repeat protein
MGRIRVLAGIVTALGTALPSGLAGADVPTAKVQASPPRAEGMFGASVAKAGDLAVIGATGTDRAVYLFTRQDAAWKQSVRIPAPADAHGQFGMSVAVGGETVVVGSPGIPDLAGHEGSAYVFVRERGTGAWKTEQRLTAPGNLFGSAVAISGNTLLVGGDEFAYVFVRGAAGWVLQQKLLPETDDALGNSEFGWLSVSVDGDTAAVSAYRVGAAYVFHRSGETWTRQARLVAPEPAYAPGYGRSVALGGGRLVVGAPQSYDKSTGPGAAFVFKRASLAHLPKWVQEARLTPALGVAGDLFGESVAISGDDIVAAAPQVDPPGGRGYACVFTLDRQAEALAATGHGPATALWPQTAVLRAPDARPTHATEGGATIEGDLFGSSVAIDGRTVLVGAPRSKIEPWWPTSSVTSFEHAGLVRIYKLNDWWGSCRAR